MNVMKVELIGKNGSKQLVITMPVTEPRLTAKMSLIALSGGWKDTEVTIGGKVVKVNAMAGYYTEKKA